MASSDPNNPGSVLASAVDAEVAKFREMQESLAGLQRDLQLVLGQAAENDMVLQELQLVEEGATVYKTVGPVLMAQDTDEAVQTVKKRLEFIGQKRDRLQNKVVEQEQAVNQQAAKIKKMQADLQQTTAQAVQAIAAQHQAGKK
jgi:prefoldin beta subunit